MGRQEADATLSEEDARQVIWDARHSPYDDATSALLQRLIVFCEANYELNSDDIIRHAFGKVHSILNTARMQIHAKPENTKPENTKPSITLGPYKSQYCKKCEFYIKFDANGILINGPCTKKDCLNNKGYPAPPNSLYECGVCVSMINTTPDGTEAIVKLTDDVKIFCDKEVCPFRR